MKSLDSNEGVPQFSLNRICDIGIKINKDMRYPQLYELNVKFTSPNVPDASEYGMLVKAVTDDNGHDPISALIARTVIELSDIVERIQKERGQANNNDIVFHNN